MFLCVEILRSYGASRSTGVVKSINISSPRDDRPIHKEARLNYSTTSCCLAITAPKSSNHARCSETMSNAS